MNTDAGAFPASPDTPGQAESRSAYGRLQNLLKGDDDPTGAPPVWAEDYLLLRAEGWDWRKAAYIAWASSPAGGRWPANQFELANQVLGLRSDRIIRKWREHNPAIDERVAALQVEPLLRHRRDVIEALVRVASTPDTAAHQDRKLFLQMTGDFVPKQELSGPEGEAIEIKQLDYRIITNALEAGDGDALPA